MDAAAPDGHGARMNARFLIPLLAALMPGAAPAQTAGDFDYYVLTLSWSPSWCRTTGDGRGAPECAPGSGRDFTVHGLWPQYERGWPDYCDTAERDPSRRETQGMADLMATGLAQHQWRKHGRCSGLSAADYYATTRKAWDSITIPAPLDDLNRSLSLPPSMVEDAFLEANPGLTPDGITVSCQGQTLTEIRICLTRDLKPRNCAPDTRRDCSARRVLMEKVR